MLKISHSNININFSTRHTEVKQTEPYIIFTVDNEEFGIEALKVLELVNYMAPLKMPSNFANVQGMASYRGKIIPIIDLRKIFGLEPIGYDDATVTIVVESVCTFGITAERVLDLEFIPVISIKNIKAFNFGEKTKYLKSVANFGDRLVLLLDLDKMIETKTAQPIFEEPNHLVSLTQVEADHELHGTKLDSAAAPAADLILDSKTYGAVEATPEPRIETGLVEENSPMSQETLQIKPSQPEDYLIDPKELEDLLKGITKPRQEEETSLANETESILVQFEREQKEENEQPNPFGINLGEDFQAAPMNEVQKDLSSDNPADRILEPEQITKILSDLESDPAVELPEDLFQTKTTADLIIDMNQTEERLSDEAIEDILTELEAQSQPDPKELSSGRELPNLKADPIKGPEERSDV